MAYAPVEARARGLSVVCHLAGKVCEALRTNGTEIDDRDVLSVQIAGLCHDLGHGPLSHFFDGRFMPKLHPAKAWKHEDFSVAIFERIARKLENEFDKYGLRDKINFIKYIIGGPDSVTDHVVDDDKKFLYQIVANKESGFDVDKFDYLARDCLHLNLPSSFDQRRLLLFIRVCEFEGQLCLCLRDKEAGNLYQMYYNRYTIHRYACYHKSVVACNMMATDALMLVKDFYQPIPVMGRWAENIRDNVESFLKLDDSFLWDVLKINMNESPISNPEDVDKLEKAKKLVCRLQCRDLYFMVAEKLPIESILDHLERTQKTTEIVEEISTKLKDKSSEKITGSARQLCDSDFRIEFARLDLSMNSADPLCHMTFFAKHNPKAFKMDNGKRKRFAGIVKPDRAYDVLLRVYSCISVKEHEAEAKHIQKLILDSWNELAEVGSI